MEDLSPKTKDGKVDADKSVSQVVVKKEPGTQTTGCTTNHSRAQHEGASSTSDHGAEAMDTNNNNNHLSSEENMATEAQKQSFDTPSKSRWEPPAFSDSQSLTRPTLGTRKDTARTTAKQQQNNDMEEGGKDPVSSHDAADEHGTEKSGVSGRYHGIGASSMHHSGITSPDFPNISGTPTSISQLLQTIPSSSTSLEGMEFPSPMGSGQFSPLTSARLGRKRGLSISPLSSSSLDLNSLIRTSPTSLVNYIANSRGSSAGSIGHLSPSLFANPAFYQTPHSRPPQFSLRNSNYPFSASSNPTTTVAIGTQNGPVNQSQSSMQIKKEYDDISKLPDFEPLLPSSLASSMLSQQSIFMNGGATVKQEFTSLSPSLKGMTKLERDGTTMSHHQGGGLLETVQEEPAGIFGSSEDDEGMNIDHPDYTSALMENDADFDCNSWSKSSDCDKPKRVYYSYPSVEEPHNNSCRWAECEKQCGSLEELVHHVNSDHIYKDSRKEFVCYWTGCVRQKKPFKAQYMLLVHMRRHTGEKPHKCHYDGCNKAYSRLENLKTHLRSHTGERPYICKYEGCGKAFSNASDCAKHMNRTHSDEKPYACPNPGCTKRYTDPSSRRKHMKNCQVNKKARTEDAMSGIDEESSAEMTNTSSSLNNNGNKKVNKPKKADKRKGNNNIPSLRVANMAHAYLQQQPSTAILSGDNGYGSEESQGYGTSHAAGYNSSSGYEAEYQNIHGEGPEEIARILQEQRLSDPHDNSQFMVPSSSNPQSQGHMTSINSPNVKASRPRGGGLMTPAGQTSLPHPQVTHHHFQPGQQLPTFQSSTVTSQSGYSSYHPTHYHPGLPPPSMHPYGDTVHSMQTQLSPHGLADFGPPFTASGALNGKASRNSSSGYSSFRSSSPNKLLPGNVTKSPSDDGSLRNSIMTNSYSTFSSNSSRVSSPSSSGRGESLRSHPPHSPIHGPYVPPNNLAMTPHGQHLHANTAGDSSGGAGQFEMPSTESTGLSFPLKNSLRMSNSYPPRQAYMHKGSQDNYSDSSVRSWQYSSQSSQYSFSGSELSDDQIERLPTSVRRDSFSKNQPLPLPESMQSDFTGIGLGMEFEQNGGHGIEFLSGGTDHSQHSQPSPMQLNGGNHGMSDQHSVHSQASSTLPLHHLDHRSSCGGSTGNSLSPMNRCIGSYGNNMYSQDSGINDENFDLFFTGVKAVSPNCNMAVGDMASFASSLPEETQYLEHLLSSGNQVK